MSTTSTLTTAVALAERRSARRTPRHLAAPARVASAPVGLDRARRRRSAGLACDCSPLPPAA